MFPRVHADVQRRLLQDSDYNIHFFWEKREIITQLGDDCLRFLAKQLQNAFSVQRSAENNH